MFGYDARRAADLLGTLELFLDEEDVAHAVPDAPEAWLAWARHLRDAGRDEESWRWIEQAHERWPADLPVLGWLARRAVWEQDWPELRDLLPSHLGLPERPESAELFALRARARAELGDRPGALMDASKAARLAEGSPGVLLPTGDALLAAGEPDDARRNWNLALYHLPRDEARHSTRVSLLARLARLEDEHGRPAAALRAWRAVLEAEPDHREARRRVDELTGFQR
jgi:tetratricopeptide (TPR) repeat protein